MINEAGCPWERDYREISMDDDYESDLGEYDTQDEYDLDRELREEARCKGGW
jgi:hypothetical protein